MDERSWDLVTSAGELRGLLGEPTARVAGKVRTRLEPEDRRWLAASPFCLVATSADDGTCDVSPKGDPGGMAVVLDDTTVALPERPGNRRADGYLNVLENPHVGLIFLVPGRGDTLRINGRGHLVRGAPFIDEMVVRGHRPPLALVVDVQEVFFHCAKAFMRAGLWQPETWDPDGVESRARIAQRLERPDDSLDVVERHYGAGYADSLYG